MATTVKCPHCRKPCSWQENPWRPFCSQRCRMVDLGRWLDEDYKIPSPEPLSEEDITQVLAEGEGQDESDSANGLH